MSLRNNIMCALLINKNAIDVAETLGVTASYVRRVKRELEAGKERKPVGRPRVHKDTSDVVAEACARLIEDTDDAGPDEGPNIPDLVARIRSGAWREYL